MKIIFAGTPEFAAKALQRLIESGHEVALVLTQPDRPSGRGRKVKPSCVKEVALNYDIPLLTLNTLSRNKDPIGVEAALKLMKEKQADILVVAAYGLLIPQEVLDIPKGIEIGEGRILKSINIHGSLLPKWRGAAPIARAIEAGEKTVGITLMEMEKGLDTGPMLYKKHLPVMDSDTAGSVTTKLSQLGADMLIEFLESPKSFFAESQPEGSSYAQKLEKSEGKLDLNQSSTELSNKIRAFNPFPGCTIQWKGETLKIWMAEVEKGTSDSPVGTVARVDAKEIILVTGGGSLLKIKELQKAGGRKMLTSEFLSGHKISKGDIFQ